MPIFLFLCSKNPAKITDSKTVKQSKIDKKVWELARYNRKIDFQNWLIMGWVIFWLENGGLKIFRKI